MSRKGRWRYHYCHAGQVHNELVANQEGWHRPRRGRQHLDQWLHDKPHNYEKSWKKKRKTQYRDRSSMQEHSIYIDDMSICNWDLREWLDDHDIPYRWETVKKKFVRYRLGQYKRVEIGSYLYVDHKGITRRRSYYENRWVPYDQPKKVTYSQTIGYKLTWWSNKDIGMDYLLNRFSYARCL